MSLPILYHTLSKACFNSNSFLFSSSFQPRPKYVRSDLSPERTMAILPVQFLFHPIISLLYGLCVSGHCHVARSNSVPNSVFLQIQINFFVKYHDKPLPSIKTRFPTPDDEKEPQHFTFSPPCLTVGTVHLGSNASCSVGQTITVPSDPNKLNLLSSVHKHLIPEAQRLLSIFFCILDTFHPISFVNVRFFSSNMALESSFV